MASLKSRGAAVPGHNLETDQLLSIPIPRILEALGCGTPDSPELSAKKRQGFYLSPFHPEKTPSFHYLAAHNQWHDFSMNLQGGVLDLVCLVKGYDRNSSEGRRKAFEFLKEAFRGQIVGGFVQPALISSGRTESSGKIIVDSAGPVSREHLLAYGEQRCIPRELLKVYFFQVDYHYANRPDKKYYSLGFPNIEQGWNLMNSTSRGKIKLCTSCAPTLIDARGRFSVEPSSDTVIVCESGFDFASLMALNAWMAPPFDVCVLNSLSMLKAGGKADQYIARHANVHVMFDHDLLSQAGQRHTAELIARYPDRSVIDCSGFYAGFKDINDLLVASRAVSSAQTLGQVVKR